MKGARLKTLGIDWAETRIFPNVTASHSVDLTFGDISPRPIDVGEAESDHDSVWILSTTNGDHAFVGDLVMNGVHAYTADAHTGQWLDALTRVQASLTKGTNIYPGHGQPGGIDLFRKQTEYLEMFRGKYVSSLQHAHRFQPIKSGSSRHAWFASWDTTECPDGSRREQIQWLRKSADGFGTSEVSHEDRSTWNGHGRHCDRIKARGARA